MLDITGQGSEPLSIDDAITQIEELRSEIWINGVSIDLRRSDLGSEPWKAIGVNIGERPGIGVWFGWDHPKALGWQPGAFETPMAWRPDMARAHGPGVVLSQGDRVTLGEPVRSTVPDPALEDFDRRRVTAEVLILRANGVLDCGPEPITLADPVFMESGVGGMLVSSDMHTMKARLARLRNVAAPPGGAGNEHLLSAVEEAERQLRSLDKLIAELTQLGTTELGEPWTQSTVMKSLNAAVAFGFAVGRAGAEADLRRQRRRRADESRLKQQMSASAKTKKLEVEVIRLTKDKRPSSAASLATRIAPTLVDLGLSRSVDRIAAVIRKLAREGRLENRKIRRKRNGSKTIP